MLVRHKKARRAAGAGLVILGGGLMWLAPETPLGIVLLATGILIEVAGITLEHMRDGAGKT